MSTTVVVAPSTLTVVLLPSLESTVVMLPSSLTAVLVVLPSTSIVVTAVPSVLTVVLVGGVLGRARGAVFRCATFHLSVQWVRRRAWRRPSKPVNKNRERSLLFRNTRCGQL